MSSASGAGERPGSPSPVTVPQIRAVTFRPSPVAWRGYSPVEVKEVLDAAADSLQETQDECVGLEAEIERLRNFYRNRSSASIAAIPAPGTEGREPLGSMRRYAATQIEHAVDYADLVDERPAEADRLLKHARVRTAVVVEAAAGSAGQADAERARLWVSCFAHALRTQAAAMYDAVSRRAG